MRATTRRAKSQGDRLARRLTAVGAQDASCRWHAAHSYRPRLPLEGHARHRAVRSISELAKAEKLNASYVAHVLRRTLRIPTVTAAL